MVEKKIIVYDLRLSYNGPLKIVDFYKEVENWMNRKGMNKELKKKMEKLTAKGKQLEWTIECWKNLTHFAKDVVRLRSMFNNVREIEVKRNMKNYLMPLIEKILLRKRFLIETIFDILKIHMNLSHTRHRSPTNCCVNILSCLVAYQLRKNKPSLKSSMPLIQN